jgi:hypothetical protein
MNKGPAGLNCWDIGLATLLIPMASAQDLPRNVLPIPDREHQGLTTHQVRVEFAYDGNGIAKGGGLSLYLDGNKVGEGRIEQTEPFVFSADETLDIGFESGSSVTSDYSSNRFNGEVNWVQIDVGEDANDLDHFLNHQERLKIAMALH